jgi:hypothetical protein
LASSSWEKKKIVSTTRNPLNARIQDFVEAAESDLDYLIIVTYMGGKAMYAISTILPLFVVLFRLKMRDGKLFRKSNFKNRHVPWTLIIKKYWLRLLTTRGAFFLYDFVNFSNSIMSSAIINSLVPGNNVHTVALWQLILALFSVPRVLLGAWLVKKIGKK